MAWRTGFSGWGHESPPAPYPRPHHPLPSYSLPFPLNPGLQRNQSLSKVSWGTLRLGGGAINHPGVPELSASWDMGRSRASQDKLVTLHSGLH